MKSIVGLVLFFVFLLASLLVPPWPLPVSVVERTVEKSSLPKCAREAGVLQKVKVDYEIEYGTIYTGDQTPIVHRGSVIISTKKDVGIGSNGLPILGFFPLHSDITFKLYNGEEATLHIPVLSLKQVNGLLEFKDLNHMFMTVEVSKKESGTFFVHAFSAADQGTI
ncbi:MAG: hypothetical protein PHE24_04530 [Patescibacteria group bacterium]|nr:hypothetical protein [Patescibacteria group bacterium]